MVTAPTPSGLPTEVTMMSLGLVASMQFPVSEPFPGGMEAQTHDLAKGLRRRGHAVDIDDGAATMPVELDPRRIGRFVNPNGWKAAARLIDRAAVATGERVVG